MAQKSELIDVEISLENLGVDILSIERDIFSFYNKINTITTIKRGSVTRLQECILHFRNSKNKLRNLLKPEENKYIDREILNKMDEDIGRIDEAINKIEKYFIDKSDEFVWLEKGENRNIRINPLKNLLIEAMDILVVSSIINASKKYNSLGEKIKLPDGTEIDKDVFYFNYLLFQEMFPASQSVGGITRQEMRSFPKNITLFNKDLKPPTFKYSENKNSEEGNLFEDDILEDETYT